MLPMPPQAPTPAERKANPSVFDQFVDEVREYLAEHVSLRYSPQFDSLAIHTDKWYIFSKRKDTRHKFWREVYKAIPAIRASRWSLRAQEQMFEEFFLYLEDITFNNRHYFEMQGQILDTLTGEFDTSADRHLKFPTLRGTLLAYDPEYTPTKEWQQWYDSMDSHQRAIREWSVGSAASGQHGLLMTIGNAGTGKSLLAEGISQPEVIGDGARTLKLTQDWGQFQTSSFENTTYLYDGDSKGAKSSSNKNYETVSQMATGDKIKMERKFGDAYESDNYGFMEIISNSPVALSFEQSLVRRVRFCLFTYVPSFKEDHRLKVTMLADHQAWLNYTVECAVKVAKGEISKPLLDDYQLFAWVTWLSHTTSYGATCFEQGRILSYGEYKSYYQGSSFLVTEETHAAMQEGMEEIMRQYSRDTGKPMENLFDFKYRWKDYNEKLEKGYLYGEATELF